MSASNSETEVDVDVYGKVRTVSYGAILTILSNGTRRLLILITNLILTRGLSPVLYSAYALSWRLINTLKIFVPLGADATAVRDGARSPNRAHRSTTASLSYATTLIGGLFIGVLAYWTAPWLNRLTLDSPELLAALRIAAITLPFAGFVIMNGHFLRGMQEVERLLILKDVGWPLARLVAVALTIYLGYQLIGVVAAICGATVLLGLLGMIYALRSTDTGLAIPTRKRIREFYNHALPRAFSKISAILRTNIYIFLVGILVLDKIAAGQFNVLLLLSEIASVPLIGFNKLLPPIASELHSTDRTDVLNQIYSAVTRLITTLTLPAIVLMVFFGREVLSLFGPDYVPAFGALIIILIGRLVGNCVGATGWLLLMTDNQYPQLYLDWILALINIPLSYVLITQWGLPGAALGYALQRGLQNLLQLGLLWKFEGLLPWDQTYLKALLATTSMVMVIVGVRVLPLAGSLELSVGISMGLLAYGISLYALGIEDLDRAVGLGLWQGTRSMFRNRLK